MLYRLSADLLVLVHAGFVLFVLAGGLLVLRDVRWIFLHVPAAIWGFLVEARGWFCPLTTWENQLRHAAGDAGYRGGFVENYVIPWLYPAGLTREIQIVLAGIVVLVNVGVYSLVYRRSKKASRRPPERI
ncbi:MAG: DUF2784 domain-containing protein [Thermoanaerobaculia bacterium]|nr:DUF2784 domain-containing protein [Thermoanaerobaculia bacterium]